MNTLFRKILFMTLSIVILAIGMGIALAAGWLWFSALLFLIIIYVANRLYKLNLKTTSQFKVFLESIRFSENGISFKNTLKDNIYVDYYENLNNTVKKLNELMQKHEAEVNFYSNLLNRIDFALIVIDNEDNIIWINKVALDILGRPRPQNSTFFKNISADLANSLLSLQSKAPRTIKVLSDGIIKNMVANLSLISIRNNSYRIFSLKDVQPVVEETEGVAWQQLISVLTHEMMNSLTPIISLSDTLSGIDTEFEPEIMSKAMSTIHRRSKGLVDFVNNYKKLTQIPPPQKEILSVKFLIEDVIDLIKMQGINLKCIIMSDNLTIEADRGQMEQVLINLIKNAWEATQERPVSDIKISAIEDSSAQIVISVSDNGCGIDPEITDKIFMPFYTTKPEGSGIGLSICRQIINLHGGTLTVTSTLDSGSIFTIRL